MIQHFPLVGLLTIGRYQINSCMIDRDVCWSAFLPERQTSTHEERCPLFQSRSRPGNSLDTRTAAYKIQQIADMIIHYQQFISVVRLNTFYHSPLVAWVNLGTSINLCVLDRKPVEYIIEPSRNIGLPRQFRIGQGKGKEYSGQMVSATVACCGTDCNQLASIPRDVVQAAHL